MVPFWYDKEKIPIEGKKTTKTESGKYKLKEQC
jgi:hypothetical protein